MLPSHHPACFSYSEINLLLSLYILLDFSFWDLVPIAAPLGCFSPCVNSALLRESGPELFTQLDDSHLMSGSLSCCPAGCATKQPNFHYCRGLCSAFVFGLVLTCVWMSAAYIICYSHLWNNFWRDPICQDHSIMWSVECIIVLNGKPEYLKPADVCLNAAEEQ